MSDLFKQMARIAYGGYVPKEQLDKILNDQPDMNTKHTPGPWSLVRDEDGLLQLGGNPDLYTSVFSESGFGSIAHVLFKKTRILGDSERLQEDTFEANARLIAAAPELLEALGLAYQVVENELGESHPLAIQIEAAIQKATQP